LCENSKVNCPKFLGWGVVGARSMSVELEHGEFLNHFFTHRVPDLLLHPSCFIGYIKPNQSKVKLGLVAAVCCDTNPCCRGWRATRDARYQYTIFFQLLDLQILKMSDDVGVIIKRATDFVKQLRNNDLCIYTAASVFLFRNGTASRGTDFSDGKSQVEMLLLFVEILESAIVTT
jgi:hypothetical protein